MYNLSFKISSIFWSNSNYAKLLSKRLEFSKWCPASSLKFFKSAIVESSYDSITEVSDVINSSHFMVVCDGDKKENKIKTIFLWITWTLFFSFAIINLSVNDL